jgi:hypothetical protein
MEYFYCASIYDLLHAQRDYQAKASALKLLKAKIVRLNAIRYKTMMIDDGEKDNYNEEEPSLFHILKERKKGQIQRTIHKLQNTGATMISTSQEIPCAFQIISQQNTI